MEEKIQSNKERPMPEGPPAADRGRKVGKRLPMRRCAGCGQSRPKKELIRVIRTPEGAISVDSTGRKNGRGVYLCPNRECLRKAHRSKGLERSLKTAVPREIYDNLEKELRSIEDE